MLVSKSSAPSAWHLLVERDALVLCRENGDRFSLSADEIERRLDGFSQSGLAKACQVATKPTVLDGLSGWGTDGLSLAIAGCTVVCCEMNPLVLALSKARMLAMGMNVTMVNDDVSNIIATQGKHFDVIYLDEMFPDHPKGALPSKAMQVLSELATTCDIEGVFEQALKVVKSRVVVKRRRLQPPLSIAPSWSIQSKTVRFDVYTRNNH